MKLSSYMTGSIAAADPFFKGFSGDRTRTISDDGNEMLCQIRENWVQNDGEGVTMTNSCPKGTDIFYAEGTTVADVDKYIKFLDPWEEAYPSINANLARKY